MIAANLDRAPARTLTAVRAKFPIPSGGFGTPDQIASAIAFLLSPDAAFVYGSVLFADGGTDALLRADTF